MALAVSVVAACGAANSSGHTGALITCPHTAAIDNIGNGNGTGYTLSFWWYSGNSTSLNATAFKDTGNVGFSFFGAQWYRRTSGTRLQLNFSNTLVSNTMYNIVVTWDGSLTATNSHIYLNNVEATYSTQQNGTGTLNNDSTSDLQLLGNGSTGQPGGPVWDYALWNVVLSSTDRSNIYGAKLSRMPLQIKPGSLKLYLPLDDKPDGTNLGSTVKDLSGNGNVCTVTGTIVGVGNRFGVSGGQ